MSHCVCGSSLDFTVCCEPIITGIEPAKTAEALMRARYSAYVVRNIEFLGDSLHPKSRYDWDEEATRKWAEEARWEGLEVLSTEQGGENDSQGLVEFRARFIENGELREHHEISHFLRQNDRWYYVDGHPPKPVTVKREGAKVGRNEPCPCGSGKKYKKCCGA